MDAGSLREAFRRWGYLQADLDPLGRLPPLPVRELDSATGPEADRWRRAYCGPIGAEFGHLRSPQRRDWIAGRMEAPAGEPDATFLLRRLAEAELAERFLHRRYVGTKRYSLEGSAAVIPFLDRVLDVAAGRGAESVIVAMAHRGRLNVMVNVVGIPFSHIVANFEDVDPGSVLGGGDLAYHVGATGTCRTESGRSLHVHLVSNPSHLDAVDAVAMGRARARQGRIGAEGRRKILPVTLHGDAAIAGQGTAAETLNLAELRGFTVGGTIRLVVDNLIGFTTEPAALHSGRFATDVARRLDVPILHVNGSDPDAVVRAASIAADFRYEFGSDVVVDLIGFRRYGHSEVDDPTTTQPLLYRRIASLPMLWESYADARGISPEERRSLEETIQERLNEELEKGRAARSRPSLRTMPAWWDDYSGGPYDPSMEVDTNVGADTIERIADALTTVPDGFHLHPKVARGLSQRREMGRGERAVDWGMAEALAFGSLLLEGTLVRLAGEDSRRGTFNHRHSVLHDVETGEEHVPLRCLGPSQGRFDPCDTPLSEAAGLGFEYGFSRDYPDALVCWEAQFGDFVNGAQIVIDQFLAAGEDKWDLLSGLVLLLPHGFEGQGPEHSSARLERFLDLAAEDNLQVCQPSTAAQYFHVLRRQARRRWRKPLIVLTPKGLLRSAATASPREELIEGRFHPVLPAGGDGIERLLICSGKIAHELLREKDQRGARAVGIVRLEQLYPFPEEQLGLEMKRHAGVREILWVQEEPANMGALRYIRPHLQRLAGDLHVRTVRRSASASPATGSARAHAIEQQALLDLALGATWKDGPPSEGA